MYSSIAHIKIIEVTKFDILTTSTKVIKKGANISMCTVYVIFFLQMSIIDWKPQAISTCYKHKNVDKFDLVYTLNALKGFMIFSKKCVTTLIYITNDNLSN